MAVPGLERALIVTRAERLEGTSLVWVEGIDPDDYMDGRPPFPLRSVVVDVGALPA